MPIMAPKLPAGREGVGPGIPCSFQYFHFPQSHQYPRPKRVAPRRAASKSISIGHPKLAVPVLSLMELDWALISELDVSGHCVASEATVNIKKGVYAILH